MSFALAQTDQPTEDVDAGIERADQRESKGFRSGRLEKPQEEGAEAPPKKSELAVHPLSPLEHSTPRAAIESFLTETDAIGELVVEQFWDEPTQEVSQEIRRRMQKVMQLLDLSQVPPAAREDKGSDALIYLYEVLNRIKLPPPEEIPGAEDMSDMAAVAVQKGDLADQAAAAKKSTKSASPLPKPAAKADGEQGVAKSVSWTIPHTDITLVRVAEGPQTGKFVFSADTVARAAEFYERTRHLPYRRQIPLRNYADMRPYLSMSGWLVPPRLIQSLPEWMKRSIFRQAVWKWLALGAVILLYWLGLAIVRRLALRMQQRGAYWRHVSRFLLPLSLLLTIRPLVSSVSQQLTLIDVVGEWLSLGAEALFYFALAWFIWQLPLVITEIFISRSPKVEGHSLDAHLLRFIARTLGVIAIIIILFLLSARLGAPLFSLLAGFGVGGIAVALAAQGSIENFIGSLNLFGDKPVRVGDFCRYGEDSGPDFQRIGTVEAIGMRSTRIRGIDNTLTTIPNADFSKMHIVNYSTRSAILFLTILSLRYETTEDQLRFVLVSLREMLVAHPLVVDEEPSVRLIGMSDSSLDIEVRVDINTIDHFDFRAIREDILLRILGIVRGSGTGFAFPSQTLYYSRDSGLDKERGEAAEARVREWAAAHEMPFPTFTPEQRSKRKNTLDYPPEGSPLADR
ncbi:mechanosensitive ion channel family protein [Microbulbifer aggregans]|uniref:mechanosensitive ion channel family protein n=1 Tax=Microbulbifer aggregans TaxID=1769779 RepID=UPI0011AB6A89|nr:mechanosensitive ion channel family protein [Microbulbifer aggregans]